MHTDHVRARTGNLLGAVALGVGDRVLRAAEAVGGRSGARAAALATLAQWPADTIQQLRASLGLTHSATVRVIDGLVADGLVTREHVGGGPAVRPRLTKAGYSEARRVLAARNEALQPLLGLLSDTEVAALTGILERLLGAMTSDYDAGELICRLCELDACPQDVCPVDVRQQHFKQLAEAAGRPT
jgi:MarR family transcriptional regulator, negative regulator of the multidrug operon emrRAB